MLTQVPALVPLTQSRMWSMAALAALAAEDRPRASMMAAPRFWMVGMKLFSSQVWSLIIGQIFLPPAVAWKTSGYWVAEWLPQTASFLMSVIGLPIFCATWVSARLWSRRIIAEKFDGFSLGALFIAIRQLVLAGLPTTSTLTLRLATSDSALPCGAKMRPLASSKSLRSMPGPRGRAPTSNATSASANATIGSEAGTMPASSGNAQSSSSIITPFSAFCARSSGISSNWRITGWSLPSISPLAMRNSRL